MGKCRRSTDTIKYLGKYGTYEECEAACVSYNVGKDRCRALSYYSKNFTNRKFHQVRAPRSVSETGTKVLLLVQAQRFSELLLEELHQLRQTLSPATGTEV